MYEVAVTEFGFTRAQFLWAFDWVALHSLFSIRARRMEEAEAEAKADSADPQAAAGYTNIGTDSHKRYLEADNLTREQHEGIMRRMAGIGTPMPVTG